MNRWIAAVVLMLVSDAAYAQKSIIEGYPTYQNPGVQFSGVGGQGEVAGFSQGNVTTASVAVSSFIIGTYSAPWPASPGWVTVENQSNSSGILYVAPLGGTCSTTTDIPIAAGGSYSFLNPSSAMTVCASSTATADIIWKGPGISPPIPGAYPGAALDYNFATGNYYPATFPLTVTSAGPGTAVDASGTWRQFASGVARIASGVGLTVEESRTNSEPNSTMAGGGAGTLPTGWMFANGATIAGVTISVVGIGIENGLPFIDLNFTGTSTGANTALNVAFAANTAIAATYGQTYTLSAFSRVVSGAIPSGFSVGAQLGELNSSQGFQGGSTGVPNVSTSAPGIGNQRWQTTRTVTNPTSVYILPLVYLSQPASGAVNFTLRLGPPQVELNPLLFATVASGSQTITNSGTSGCTSGTYTVSGGTGTAATLTGVASGGVITSLTTLTGGSYTVFPPSPAALTGTGCSGSPTVTLAPTNNAANAFATTPIFSSSGAATRAADVITVSLPSGACSASVCSMIATGTPAAPTGYTQNQVLARIDDGSSANTDVIFRGEGVGNPYLFQFIASAGYGGITPGTVWSSSTSGKMADLLTPTSGIIVFNNGSPASQTTPRLPVFTTLRFGSDLGGVAVFNGTIARMAVAPVSLLAD